MSLSALRNSSSAGAGIWMSLCSTHSSGGRLRRDHPVLLARGRWYGKSPLCIPPRCTRERRYRSSYSVCQCHRAISPPWRYTAIAACSITAAGLTMPTQVRGAHRSLTAVPLAAVPPGMQKRMLGEHLLHPVSQLHPDLAKKITDPMLSSDNVEFLALLEPD